MKDYLYYLFDEKMSSPELSAVKEDICATGAKVIDVQNNAQSIKKRLKELKGYKCYALMIGNTVEAQQAANQAKIDFCGLLDGTTQEEDFKPLPYRKLLSNLKLLPLLGQSYPYRHLGWVGRQVMKYTRWVHFKQIKGFSHKPKHSQQLHVCKNCGETYEGNFCPTCGQTHKTPRFDIKDLFKNILSEAINIEHGFLRNFIEMFWRPGYMVRDYLAGKRKDYHKPFQTLFVLATIYLIAAHLLDPASFVKKEEVRLEDIPTISQNLSADSANTDIVPQLFEINKLAREALSIRREQNTAKSLEMADSIMRRQGATRFLSKEDSILVIRQIMSAMMKDDSVKLSEVLSENVKDVKGIFGWGARIAAQNTAVVEKFEEKYYHEGTILYSLMGMIKDFMNMNNAVIIILFIPALVFCALGSFRSTRVAQQTNIAEYIILFTFLGSQMLWLQLLSLLFSQVPNFNASLYSSFSVLLLTWDLKQFFNLSWGNAIKRTIFYMGGYSILLAMLMVPIITMLGSVAMWFLYQIT